MELTSLPDYLLNDSIVFLELSPVAMVFLPSGVEKAEDREPHSRDIVDCMLAYTNPDLQP